MIVTVAQFHKCPARHSLLSTRFLFSFICCLPKTLRTFQNLWLWRVCVLILACSCRWPGLLITCGLKCREHLGNCLCSLNICLDNQRAWKAIVLPSLTAFATSVRQADDIVSGEPQARNKFWSFGREGLWGHHDCKLCNSDLRTCTSVTPGSPLLPVCINALCLQPTGAGQWNTCCTHGGHSQGSYVSLVPV